MKFVGLFFPGNKWNIVPDSWIINVGKDLKCLWPIDGDVDLQAKSSTEPGSNWSKWPIKSIVIRAGEFIICFLELPRKFSFAIYSSYFVKLVMSGTFRLMVI